MKQANTFNDDFGGRVSAFIGGRGVAITTYNGPELTPEQARQFAQQLIELANEAEANQ